MQRLLATIFDFYIQSSIHVALAVVSLLYVFTLSLELPADESLVLALFFGTITGYNFVKYASVAKLHHRSLTRSLKLIQMFSLASFVLMCFYALKLPIRTLMIFGLITVLTFLYAVPLVASKNIRSLAGVKIYVVAICWSLAVVIAPAMHYDFALDGKMIIKFIQISLLVTTLIIPFDIRDLAFDLKQLKTIPQQLGVVKAKIIAVILMLIFCGLEFYLDCGNLVIIAPFCVLVASFVVLMPRRASTYYCSFWVESLPVIYMLSIIIQLS